MSKNNTKFALYRYTTENIGDDIQSIAARRFLPRVDYLIDRDRVGEWKNDNPHEVVKLITNGWYMHQPYSWPITDPTIDPLYISMYVEQYDQDAVKNFLSRKSRLNFKKFGKIGARDKNTHSFFAKHNIDSYVSRCITLTMQADKTIKKQDFVLLVDVHKEVYDFVRRSTKRNVLYLTNAVDPLLSQEQRDELAEMHLRLYQSAHCVITERLHAALPSLALGTPVLLLKKKDPVGGNVDRLGGLGELCHYYSDEEFMTANVFDVDNPPENPTEYMAYREELINTCRQFTGYSNDNTFSAMNIGNMPLEDILARMEYMKSEGLRTSATGYIRSGQQIVHLNTEIEHRNTDIAHLHAEIERLNADAANLHAEIERLNGVKASARKLLSNTKRKVTNTYRKP